MTDDFPIIIYHNPDCGTSRNALGMIRAAGYEPVIVEYLIDGWSRPVLESFLADMPATVRGLLREKGTPAKELGLLEPHVSDDEILQAMIANPILVNRPIVATKLGVALCRPSELVLNLMDKKPGSFVKEDGGVVSI